MIKPLSVIGIFIFAYSLLTAATLQNTGLLILELASYILPYIIVFNLLVIGIFLLILFITHTIFKSPLLTSSLIFLIIMTFYLITRFVTFTYLHYPDNKNIGLTKVRLAFFNKLYSNTNYIQIDEKLAAVNPEILGFTELKKEDVEKISYLKKYRYSYTKPARDNSMIAVFSNIPLKSDTSLLLPYALSFTANIYGKEIRMFAIHPQPPINTEWLTKRNSELESLGKYIKSLNTQNVVIMGDFNLSPWSNIYQKLINQLPTLRNAAIGQGIQFTWSNKYISTQVDHIFVPVGVNINKFKSEKINGSDHKLIWAELMV